MRRFEFCVAGALALAAVSTLVSHSTRPVGLVEAGRVLGGNLGLTYKFKACGPSNDCGTIPCAPNPQGVMTCPNGSTQFTSNLRNYPIGTQLGNLFTAANPLQYLCGFDRACSMPCQQAVVPPFNSFCGGQVGPNSDHFANGVVGNGVLPPNE